MPSRFIEKVSSLDDIQNLPGSAGIGSYAGVPFARTDAGLIQLGLAGPGKRFFLDPLNGSDLNDGLSPANAKATLDGTAGAFSLATAGKNDIIFLIGNGATTATERIDAAFDWNKAATHLVGISSGAVINNRARIAPTASTTAFAAFFTVSASGCLFQNIAWVHAFTTGVASAICVTLTGSRNKFVNCHFAGMADAESAQDAGSRCVKFTGASENEFVGCVFGVDTIDRTTTNATLEFVTASARNRFIDCEFLMTASAATPNVIKVGTSGTDRYNIYENCRFLCSIIGTGVPITGVVLAPANPGGMQVFFNPMCLGVLTYGYDATSDLSIRIAGGVVPANGALIGLSVAPAA